MESRAATVSAQSPLPIDQATLKCHDGEVHNDDGLKICLVVEPCPITYTSGYTNRFRHMLRYISEKAINDSVTIVTTEVVAKERPATAYGFPIRYTYGVRLPLYPSMSISLDWTGLLPRTLLRHRPDLIHVTTPGIFALTTVFWARFLQIPIVLSYHTHLPVYVRSYLPRWVACLAEPLIWWLLRIVHGLADHSVVTSTALQEEFRQHGIHRADVWPKGVDADCFHPKFASLDWRRQHLTAGIDNKDATRDDDNIDDGDVILLLYVGRLAVEKRLDELRAVMDLLPRRYRLALVGHGPQEEELRALFADCGDRVVFTGPLYHEDLQAAFASADIFVMPSDSETLGFVVMEAMASGIPVVAAKAGGIPDMVVHGETGFLVPVGDVEAAAHAIDTIGSDAVKRRQMGALSRALTETWTWEASMTYLRQEIYKQTLRNFEQRWEQRLWRLLAGRKL